MLVVVVGLLTHVRGVLHKFWVLLEQEALVVGVEVEIHTLMPLAGVQHYEQMGKMAQQTLVAAVVAAQILYPL